MKISKIDNSSDGYRNTDKRYFLVSFYQTAWYAHDTRKKHTLLITNLGKTVEGKDKIISPTLCLDLTEVDRAATSYWVEK